MWKHQVDESNLFSIRIWDEARVVTAFSLRVFRKKNFFFFPFGYVSNHEKLEEEKPQKKTF